MRFVADLHIHSHFSIATSRRLDPEHLDLWARLKGVTVVGTGDFTHPGWTEELRGRLEPAEEGLFRLQADHRLPETRTAVVAERPVSFHSPEVVVHYPNGGELLDGPEVVVEWAAWDKDGDELAFALQYSVDGGDVWQTLAANLPEETFAVPLGEIPGSDDALIRVIASDGVNTAWTRLMDPSRCPTKGRWSSSFRPSPSIDSWQASK